jgi:hypothetical protein
MIKLRPATIKDLAILEHWDSKEHVIQMMNGIGR